MFHHKRYFNTSGPNNPKRHYTLLRSKLIQKGIDLVENLRYFTIWAPRQTGKSTYFLLLKDKLIELGYKVCWANFENFRKESVDVFLNYLQYKMSISFGKEFKYKTIGELFTEIMKINTEKCVLIIDKWRE